MTVLVSLLALLLAAPVAAQISEAESRESGLYPSVDGLERAPGARRGFRGRDAGARGEPSFLQNLSTEERQAVREKMKTMSPEERESFRAELRQKWLSGLTPEQRAEFDARQSERREKLQDLSPEQRAEFEARRSELRGAREDLSPEERQQRRAAMRERFQSMSEEDREAFRAKMGARRGGGRRGRGGF